MFAIQQYGKLTKDYIPMPSRIDRFGLMISLELTRNISPIYRWFVGTKTLHNSSSSLSLWQEKKEEKRQKQILATIWHIKSKDTNWHTWWLVKNPKPKVNSFVGIKEKYPPDLGQHFFANKLYNK